MRLWVTGLLCLVLAACNGYTTRTRETGYKGKANLDAYLAATRFLEKHDYEVVNKPGWPKLEDASIVIVPASVLATDAYVREIDGWVADGGHLLCLIEHAGSFHNDWSMFGGIYTGEKEVPESLGEWLETAGLKVSRGDGSKVEAKRLKILEDEYEVFAESTLGIQKGNRARRTLAQADYGNGMITVMADARPFRNRYIADHDHAALLLTLVEMSPYEGNVTFIRDAGLSLWTLLWKNGWPALAGLLAVTLFWLWKNMPRFGPLRREEEPTNLRDYDHHLEALGDFQWRLDKGAALLRPLRDSVLDRAQRLAAVGHRDADLFEWIAQRAGVTRERAQRAMTHEHPGDATSFTRVLADLQKIHLSLS